MKNKVYTYKTVKGLIIGMIELCHQQMGKVPKEVIIDSACAALKETRAQITEEGKAVQMDGWFQAPNDVFESLLADLTAKIHKHMEDGVSLEDITTTVIEGFREGWG